MNFTVIDVETANADLASICQIGLVTFREGAVATAWCALVNPEDDFDGMNVAIHGITDDMVRDQPTLPTVFPKLQECMTGNVVVCHTGFDRCSLVRASEKYTLPTISCTWLDSARVVRRTWPAYAHSGYGLKNVAKSLGISFKHHDAQEDARAAGEILLRAIAESARSLDDWLIRVRQPISGEVAIARAVAIAREGNPEGPLAGEVVVFTGALTIPRREAAALAATAGCNICDGVNKQTTLLVVGEQDIRRLAGHEKSSKHAKAEALIAKGQAIRILIEGDFRRLLQVDGAI